MNKSRILFLLLCTINFCVEIVAQDINVAVNRFVEQIREEASHSICIVNSMDNSVLVESDSHKRMVPASLLKLSTTAAALELLGDSFQFQTHCYITGIIDDFTLQGNLIIEGGGDPTLGSSQIDEVGSDSFFKRIASALVAKDIRKIDGDILLIDDFFGPLTIPEKRIWEDIGNYYGAIPHGLTYRDNSFNVYLNSPNNVGGKCSIVQIDPELAGVTLNCNITSADNNKDNANILGVDGLKTWNVNGTIPRGQTCFVIKGAMPNPAMVLGDDLKSYLVNQSIEVLGLPVVVASGEVKTSKECIVVFKSLPLSEIIKVINHNSNNLYADHLFLMLGKQMSQNGSWIKSSEVLINFWDQKIGTEFVVVDGSGLSPINCISASEMTSILTYMKRSDLFEVFKASMAVGGESGTVKNMWKDYPGKVVAKSGSMAGVLGYAGFVDTIKGNRFIFTVMVNHSTKPASELKRYIEQLINSIILEY